MKRWLSRVAVALWAGAAVPGGHAAEGGAGGELEAREAAIAAAALAGENERLREEVAALKAELAEARQGLAKALADLDIERSRAAGGGAAGAARAVGGEGQVVDADPGLGMVVFGMGADQGVRPGMRFAVVRGDRVVARLRATDVRPGVTGALVEEAEKEKDFPRAGDRVVIWRGARDE